MWLPCTVNGTRGLEMTPPHKYLGREHGNGPHSGFAIWNLINITFLPDIN